MVGVGTFLSYNENRTELYRTKILVFPVFWFGFGFVSKKYDIWYRNQFLSYTESEYPKTEYQTLSILKFDYLIV